MARVFLILNCCMLLAVLCLVGDVVECRQVSRRRDVHRIILKEKNRSRPKKHARPPPYHNEFSHGHFDSPRDPFADQIGEYTNHYVRYHNHQVRDHHRPNYHHNAPQGYYQNFAADFNFHPQMSDADTSAGHQNHHVMDIEEFNKHQDGYRDNLRSTYNEKFPGDYERYKHLMERYNTKSEEQIRIKVKENKQQVPHVAEESLTAMATHNFPVAWHSQASDAFKGSWNPVSTFGVSPETKFASTTTNNLNIKDFPHRNIEDIIELTTSKAHPPPSMIVETNFTKYRPDTYNLDLQITPVHHPNHKCPKNKPVELHSAKYRNKNVKNGSYQVHEEESGDPSGLVLGSFQNLAPVPSTSSYIGLRKPEKLVSPNPEGFGFKTKARRTKRPAVANK